MIRNIIPISKSAHNICRRNQELWWRFEDTFLYWNPRRLLTWTQELETFYQTPRQCLPCPRRQNPLWSASKFCARPDNFVELVFRCEIRRQIRFRPLLPYVDRCNEGAVSVRNQNLKLASFISLFLIILKSHRQVCNSTYIYGQTSYQPYRTILKFWKYSYILWVLFVILCSTSMV